MATNIGMMDSAYFVGRNEILAWINARLRLNLSRVEESYAILMYAFEHGPKQRKTGVATTEPNFLVEIHVLSKQIMDLKLSADLLENERDFYFTKLREIEILCQAPELEHLPMAVAEKNVLYASDTKARALSETQEFSHQAADADETQLGNESNAYAY